MLKRLWGKALGRALLASDGQPRRLFHRLVFRSDGKARWAIRRTLFKRSGLARRFSDPRVTDYLNSMGLLEWVSTYDTPDQATLNRMSGSAAMIPRVGLIVDTTDWTEQDLRRFEAARASLVGIAYDVWYIAPTEQQKNLLMGTGRVPSARIFSTSADLPDMVVLVSAGALPGAMAFVSLIDRLVERTES